jgi:hypothetical protein
MPTDRNEVPAAQPTRPVKSGVPYWLWAGVAALFFLTVYTAWDARILREEMGAVNARAVAEMKERVRLEAELETLQREARILSDPSSVKIVLPAQTAQLPQLEAIWQRELGLIVTGQKVPAPSGDRVLQLWLIPKAPGSKPMPSLTMRPEADGKVFLLVVNPPAGIPETKALAITEEPAGGSPQPTSALKWVGGVR